MTDGIIEIRERLVELSKDPIETRELLDKLTEQEIDKSNLESVFHVLFEVLRRAESPVENPSEYWLEIFPWVGLGAPVESV